MAARRRKYSTVEWAGKTYPEIKDVGGENGSVLVLPIGSLEQHGEHLPVITDTLLVEEITIEAGERLTSEVPLLVLPSLIPGHSPHHLSFGGTASLSSTTLINVLEEIAESTQNNGFDALFIINGHGGNDALIANAVSEIGSKQPSIEVTGLTYFYLGSSFVGEMRESGKGGMAHGGELETALMQYLRPDLVRGDKMVESLRDEKYSYVHDDMFDPGKPMFVYRPFEEYTETGTMGAPEMASAKKGEEWFREYVQAVASVIREIHIETRDA